MNFLYYTSFKVYKNINNSIKLGQDTTTGDMSIFDFAICCSNIDNKKVQGKKMIKTLRIMLIKKIQMMPSESGQKRDNYAHYLVQKVVTIWIYLLHAKQLTVTACTKLARSCSAATRPCITQQDCIWLRRFLTK